MILGIGAGEVGQYASLGLDAEGRYGRLEEVLAITRALLREGHAEFAGRHYEVRDAELPLRGPRGTGHPILLGTYPAPGHLMRRLAAQYADGWNGWLAFDISPAEAVRAARIGLDQACRGDRSGSGDAGTQRGHRSRAPRSTPDLRPSGHRGRRADRGAEELAEKLRAFAREGISHVQVYLGHTTVEDIETFASVLDLLDSGSPIHAPSPTP